MSIWADSLSAATEIVRDTFPTAVSYTAAAGGGAQAITGVYDEAHEAVELDGEVAVSTTRPMFEVRIADLAAPPAQGDTFTVTASGRTFRVSDDQPDGSGNVKLYLLET